MMKVRCHQSTLYWQAGMPGCSPCWLCLNEGISISERSNPSWPRLPSSIICWSQDLSIPLDCKCLKGINHEILMITPPHLHWLGQSLRHIRVQLNVWVSDEEKKSIMNFMYKKLRERLKCEALTSSSAF